MSQPFCIITSPAKKMNTVDCPPWPKRQPRFLTQARQLTKTLQKLSKAEAQKLWHCSDRLAALNYKRLQTMDLTRNLTAAVIAYEGIQYQHLAASIMNEQELVWLDRHLRILSGLYGVLQPLDGVVPYRLEMQARMSIDTAHNLYDFWGDMLYATLAQEYDLIVNVASVEYARAVTPWVDANGPQVLTCLFGTLRDGHLKQVATEAKATRGTFIRWCAERDIEDPADLQTFDQRGYHLDRSLSDKKTLVFVQ